MKNRNRITAIVAGVLIVGFVPTVGHADEESVVVEQSPPLPSYVDEESVPVEQSEPLPPRFNEETPGMNEESPITGPTTPTPPEPPHINEESPIVEQSQPLPPYVDESLALPAAADPTVSVSHSPEVAPPAVVDTVPSRDSIRGARGGW